MALSCAWLNLTVSLFSSLLLSALPVLRFHFSGAEVMFAAEQQLEAAQGVQDTPFVTMKLTINEQHEIIVEAFQVLCMW
jgi:hypothetical protein